MCILKNQEKRPGGPETGEPETGETELKKNSITNKKQYNI